MRIVVTGAAGFIGSHLCKHLINEGHNVVGVDNLFCGSTSNLKELENNKNFDFINHDVNYNLFVHANQIYHLACPASPVWYQKDPVFTLRTNVTGTINMLELARACKARILLSSTSEVYGDPLVHPQTESYWGNVNCTGIRSCYDEGKRCAETLMFDYHRQHKVDIRVIRIFNTYGPNMAANDGRVVSNFIMQALRNEDITVYGGGLQTRSFQYVSDLISGMTKMMNQTGFIGPVNIGNPQEFTILELAQKVIEMTNSKSKIIYCDLPKDDPKQRKPVIDLAKEKLNWHPSVKLDDGLRETINYFRGTQGQLLT